MALLAITGRVGVSRLIAGQPMDDASWAGVATQVVDAIVDSAVRKDSGFQQLGQRIDQVREEFPEIPMREFEEHMAAGRRYVRDLPDRWRGTKERKRLVRDARREFVHAYGIAETMGSPERQALADVAIAGCWLWVPSLPDVHKTMGKARTVLEDELLHGRSLPTTSYRDVVRLCKAYGVQPTITAEPVIPNAGRPPIPGARLAVRAAYDRWVACADVDVLVEPLWGDGEAPVIRTESGLFIPDSQPRPETAEKIRVRVRNRRPDWLAVSANRHAVFVQLPGAANTLPSANRVRPHETAAFDLPRQSGAATGAAAPHAVPGVPRIGFALPSPSAGTVRTTAAALPTSPAWLTERFLRFPPQP